ncbi:hypothetical protein VitviT2T_030588 [Vitis vinifera]|uniref:Uncharacterized protein n=1 Tax=Vitis vinifera TaxID=29760 RepID=A0ABY9E2E6_VITVI|nr:hypothetical protein VitviT2T_030588 [Vitis vinifera]
MEIIFSRPSEDGTIPLNIIAEGAKLSVEDVEYLFMKSLSVFLVGSHGFDFVSLDMDNNKVAQGLNVLCKEMTW